MTELKAWKSPRCSSACWDEIKVHEAARAHLVQRLLDVTRDRDEWKQQHENLLAIRQQESLSPPHTGPQRESNITPFAAGFLNDFGGGNVQWWWDYIRYLLRNAHDHYVEQVGEVDQDKPTSPDPLSSAQRISTEEIAKIAKAVTVECKAEMIVRDRLANNGRNPANKNAGIKVGSDLHLMEMLIAEIDSLRRALVANLSAEPVASVDASKLGCPEQQPVAWQYRYYVAQWLPWREIDVSLGRFREQSQFNLDNGTCEIRPLYALPPQPVSVGQEATNFCNWLRSYFASIAGKDELTATEANTIRGTLNMLYALPPSPGEAG